MARRPQQAQVSTRPVTGHKDPFTDSSGWSVPVLTPGATFSEIASGGLRQFSGWVREEFLPQLVGRQAARVYREMYDNSPTVGALIFAVQQAIRQVEWTTEAASDKADAVEMAEFADSLRHDMSHTWQDFVTEALSMLIYGFAPHEIVYKRRLGDRGRDQAGPHRARSAYDDGRIGWRKLPIRGQDTILKWFFGINGEVLGLTQQPWVGSLIDLPIEKMLLFRPSQHKQNPEGRSILRSAYVPYFFTKRLQEQEAILAERFSGLPVMYVPSEVFDAASAPTPDPNAVNALNACKRLVTNIRIDEQAGVVLPGDPWMGPDGKPTGLRRFELQLVTPQAGRAGIDIGGMIQRYKIDILTTALADFVTMGHEVRGTNNLASVKVDMFYQAVESWVDEIANVVNQYALPRIWRLNRLDPKLMPRYATTVPQRADLDGLGGFLSNLASAGMTLFPDESLESFVRDAAGLPDVGEQDAYAATAGRPEVMKQMLAASMARRIMKARGTGIRPRVRVRAGSQRIAA